MANGVFWQEKKQAKKQAKKELVGMCLGAIGAPIPSLTCFATVSEEAEAESAAAAAGKGKKKGKKKKQTEEQAAAGSKDAGLCNV